MRILNQSHSAENEREGPSGIFNTHSVAKYQKIEEGPFEGF